MSIGPLYSNSPTYCRKIIIYFFPGIPHVDVRVSRAEAIHFMKHPTTKDQVISSLRSDWGPLITIFSHFENFIPTYSSLTYDNNLKVVRLSQDREESYETRLDKIRDNLRQVSQVYLDSNQPLPEELTVIEEKLSKIQSSLNDLVTFASSHISYPKFIRALRSELAFTYLSNVPFISKVVSFISTLIDNMLKLPVGYSLWTNKDVREVLIFFISNALILLWLNFFIYLEGSIVVIIKSYLAKRTYLNDFIVRIITLITSLALLGWVTLPLRMLTGCIGYIFFKL